MFLTDLVLLLTKAQSWCTLFNKDAGDTLGTFSAGTDHDHIQIRHASTANECFASIQNILIAHPLRRRRQGRSV